MAEKMVVNALPLFQTEAKVCKVSVKTGQAIREGDSVVSVESAKGAMDLKSTVTGTVGQIHVAPGDTVKVGSLLFELQAQVREITVASPGMIGFQTTAKVGKLRAAAGDPVEKDQVLAVLEGGKGTVEVKAPEAGTVGSLLVSEGDMVEKDAPLLTILAQAQPEAKEEAAAEKPEQTLHGQVVVLGGGPGGYVAAIRASQRGKQVILIEQDRLGGTCLNRGCIPTKALVQATRIQDAVREAELFGLTGASCQAELPRIMARKDSVVSTLVSGLDSSMDRHGITVLRGRGSVRDAGTLAVDLENKTVLVSFDDLILAPGSVVSYPPFPGADAPDNLTSDDLLTLQEIPRSLIILGGRVIAMEFAFIYRKLGTEVTVIQRSDSIFPNMDPDVVAEVHRSAEALGIRFYEGTRVQNICNTADGQKLVQFTHQGETKYLSAEKLAVATGRKPNLKGLDLETLGVKLDEKTRGIAVDSHMKTTAPHIYAIGDATNLCNLAHAASRQGLVAVDNILGIPAEMRYDAMPEAVFTDPEIGLCGKTEKECAKEGLEVLVGKFPYASNGKALVENATQGFIKVIARKQDRVLVGAALVGVSAADLLSTLCSLITMGATIDQAKAAIYAHPTVSETLSEAIEDLDGESIHK